MLEPVVVNLMHQRQQAPDFAGRKTLSRKPVEVVARQIRQDAALVLSERHFAGDEELQLVGGHGVEHASQVRCCNGYVSSKRIPGSPLAMAAM